MHECANFAQPIYAHFISNGILLLQITQSSRLMTNVEKMTIREEKKNSHATFSLCRTVNHP